MANEPITHENTEERTVTLRIPTTTETVITTVVTPAVATCTVCDGKMGQRANDGFELHTGKPVCGRCITAYGQEA